MFPWLPVIDHHEGTPAATVSGTPSTVTPPDAWGLRNRMPAAWGLRSRVAPTPGMAWTRRSITVSIATS